MGGLPVRQTDKCGFGEFDARRAYFLTPGASGSGTMVEMNLRIS